VSHSQCFFSDLDLPQKTTQVNISRLVFSPLLRALVIFRRRPAGLSEFFKFPFFKPLLNFKFAFLTFFILPSVFK
jgi:hypothetical protein